MEHNRVILGVTKATTLIFDEEFPDLKKIEIEPYAISYSRNLPLALKLVLDSGRILGVIKKEKEQLKEIIKAYGIEVVISDNRFGLSARDIESIYITHQLNIRAGLFSGIANAIHRHYMKQFTKVWVPDYEGNNSLAGRLSKRGRLKNVEYIGPLSRLTAQEPVPPFAILCLLSGPEPQRTLLENELLKIIPADKEVVMVRGTKRAVEAPVPKQVKMTDLPNAKELSQLIGAARTIICRSGYSTLMDLHALQKKNLILVPTPGQTEQAYLAAYWKEKSGAEVIDQDDLHKLLF